MAYSKELELNGVVINIGITNIKNDKRQRATYHHKVCGTKRQYKNFCSTCDKIISKDEIEVKQPDVVKEATLNANKRLITAKPIPLDTYYNKHNPRPYSTYEVCGKTDSDNLQLAVLNEYLTANSLVLPLAPFSIIKGIERQAYLFSEQGKLLLNILLRPSEIIELTQTFNTEVSKDMLKSIETFFNNDLIVWNNSDIYTDNNLIRQPKVKAKPQETNPLLAQLLAQNTPSKTTKDSKKAEVSS